VSNERQDEGHESDDERSKEREIEASGEHLDFHRCRSGHRNVMVRDDPYDSFDEDQVVDRDADGQGERTVQGLSGWRSCPAVSVRPSS